MTACWGATNELVVMSHMVSVGLGDFQLCVD